MEEFLKIILNSVTLGLKFVQIFLVVLLKLTADQLPFFFNFQHYDSLVSSDF